MKVKLYSHDGSESGKSVTLDATVFGYALLAGVVASVFFTLVLLKCA